MSWLSPLRQRWQDLDWPRATHAPAPESRLGLAVKAGLYGVSLALYLTPLTTWVGLAAALAAAVAAMILATAAHRRGLRVTVTLVIAPLALTAALFGGRWIVESNWLTSHLELPLRFGLSELVTFGGATLAVIFLLRRLSLFAQQLSLLEVLFVAGSAVVALVDHRHRMLNRPRFFADWAWSLGVDPGSLLVALGISATLVGLFFFLRGQRLLKLLTTLLLLALVGGVFFWFDEQRISPRRPLDTLGLSRGGAGEGTGKPGSNLFKDDYSSSGKPTPVAIAVLRDDFSPLTSVIYFRQKVLSLYNGHRLVDGFSGGWDRDVITEFPRSRPILAGDQPDGDAAGDHVELPATMYLMTDHPQPLSISRAVRLSPAANPNPQQFVAAYDTLSQVSATSPQRLLGRRSIPAQWSAERREHYLHLPDDPRYAALAEIIARGVDPRFAGDDLARAFAVKRFLEREGFYTMRSTHSSSVDPAAAFLFGSLRGYCVHFAHAAVYLLRSLGVASRVALGYAVQTAKRSGGSALLIMSDRAHAWPEIHLEGVGWITFDIYPERTDMPAPAPVDYDLERLMGELARGDRTAGVRPQGAPLRIPWRTLGLGVAALLGALLLLAYLIKIGRRLAPRLSRNGAARRGYIAILDRLSDLGLPRQRGETREQHAQRVKELSPHMEELTRLHLRLTLGPAASSPHDAAVARENFDRVARKVIEDLRRRVPTSRRLWGGINPVGWMRTR